MLFHQQKLSAAEESASRAKNVVQQPEILSHCYYALFLFKPLLFYSI